MRPLIHDRRGATAVITAVASSIIAAVAALSVDLGTVALEARRLQGVADLAALTAATDLVRAKEGAEATAQANGRVDTVEVELGVYRPRRELDRSERFSPSDHEQANAAKVTLTSTAPLYFGRALGLKPVAVTRRAIASRVASEPRAAFSIGSRVARLEGGVANALLSGLAGGQIGLDVMDYEALADADVSLFRWMDALKTELGLEAAGYDEVLATEVEAGRALSVLETLLGDDRAGRAVGRIADATRGRSLTIGDLVAGELMETPGLGLELSALDLASTVLEIGNGDRQLMLDLGARAGLADLDTDLAIGERPNGSPWLAVTGDGQPVIRTAQARLRLRARTAQSLAGLAQVTLPVVVELAASEARLAEIDCQADRVTLEARPGLARAWVGDVDDDALSDFKRPLAPSQTTLVSVAGLVRVKARADVEMANQGFQPLTFSEADIAAERIRTASTREAGSSLVSTLLGRLDIEVQALGLGLGLGGLAGAATALLTPLGPVLDGVLNPLLDTLGLKLGQADLRLHGLECPSTGGPGVELVG